MENQDGKLTGVSAEEFKLYRSAAYQVLYQGGDPGKFVKLLSSLQASDQTRFDKMNGIANRLLFIEQLQHAARDTQWDEKLLRGYDYSLDRLCAHLGTTCIEIAATGKHYSFPDWLKKKATTEPRLCSINQMISELTEASSNIEVEAILLEWTKSIYDQDYLDEAGLVRAFRRLFEDLPDWLAAWLSDVYFIEKGDILETWFDRISSKWLKDSDRERCRTIANYLYGQVRNRYTHTIDYFPTMENNGITIMTFCENRYYFNYFHKDGDWNRKRELSVGLREGHSESDIIRFIVVFVLRKWLGIVDTSSFLQVYWHFTNSRKMLHRFLNEMYFNMKTIEKWATFHLFIEEHNYQTHVNQLTDNIGNTLLSQIDDFDLGFLRSHLTNYLHSAKIINDKIANFEHSLQHIQHDRINMIDKFLRQLVVHPQLPGVVSHMRSLESFICQIVKTPIHLTS